MSASPVLLPEAQEELAESARWYEAQRPGLGLEFLSAIDALLLRLADAPLHHPVWAVDARYRTAVVERFPYVVFFELRGDVVEIVAIAHARRRPGYWLRRLR